MTAQPSLFDAHAAAAGLCRYGQSVDGGHVSCGESATHRACWRHGAAGGAIEACRRHASYYAQAWVPFELVVRAPRSPGWASDGDEASWVETIDGSVIA